jgi:type II secretory pathway predicted ATPase ExeA
LSYEQHFGLGEQPFSNAADSRFYYESTQHQEAMLRIQHSVSTMKGLTVVIGGPGAGKTLLARHVLEKLEQQEKEYDAALLVIVHSEITAEWLLKKIAVQLGVVNPAERKAELLPQLYERLMTIHESGKKAVVIIDEANMLKSKEIFEEFRGLSNLEVPGRKLISIVLFGIPDLETNMAVDPPLVQRVAVKVNIKPLDAQATANYVRHRMAVAGCKKEVFSAAGLTAVHRFSQGVPRLINTICDNALLESFLVKKDIVDEPLVLDVVKDLGISAVGAA